MAGNAHSHAHSLSTLCSVKFFLHRIIKFYLSYLPISIHIYQRDNLKILPSADISESMARQVPNNGGVYFVPAFAGLYAPYWRMDARGIIAGLTAFNTSHHIVRAALEATAFQVCEVFIAQLISLLWTMLCNFFTLSHPIPPILFYSWLTCVFIHHNHYDICKGARCDETGQQ